MSKKCKTCAAEKPLADFPKHSGCLDGHKGVCKTCTYLKQKQRTSADKGAAAKKYAKTPKGYIMRTYRNMLSRTLGWVKPELYAGKALLAKEEFYLWALASEDFHRLLSAYVASGYDMKLAPSIDRIESAGGYTLDNIRWLTHSANSSLGGQK